MVHLKRRRVQVVLLHVRDDLCEPVRARASEVPERAVVPFEVVVNLEALDEGVELSKLAEEGEVLSRVLSECM